MRKLLALAVAGTGLLGTGYAMGRQHNAKHLAEKGECIGEMCCCIVSDPIGTGELLNEIFSQEMSTEDLESVKKNGCRILSRERKRWRESH